MTIEPSSEFHLGIGALFTYQAAGFHVGLPTVITPMTSVNTYTQRYDCEQQPPPVELGLQHRLLHMIEMPQIASTLRDVDKIQRLTPPEGALCFCGKASPLVTDKWTFLIFGVLRRET